MERDLEGSPKPRQPRQQPMEEQVRLFDETTFTYTRNHALMESIAQDRCRLCSCRAAPCCVKSATLDPWRDRDRQCGFPGNNRDKKFCADCWEDAKPDCEAKLKKIRDFDALIRFGSTFAHRASDE